MAGAVGDSLRRAGEALLDGDLELAERVVAADEAINVSRLVLERDGIETIATQQRGGTELRLLAGILEVATELERMGDYAKDVARTVKPEREPSPAFRDVVPEFVELDCAMLERGITAFLNSDAEQALEAAADRTKVGSLVGRLHHRLLRDPPRWNINETIELISVAHDLVRFADRVVNVCERTVYVVYGEFVELNHREMIVPLEAS